MSEVDDFISEKNYRWMSHSVVTFMGKFDSNASEKKLDTLGNDYDVITLGEVFSMKPTSVDKSRARAMIPSEYFAFDAREHEVQRESGSYVVITGDIDKGNPSRALIELAVRRFVGDGVAFFIYSSSTATDQMRKWRVLIPLAKSCDFCEWRDIQEAFFKFMESQGLEMDWALARAAQPVYLPNVPPAKRGPEGEPLFYEQFVNDGDGLTVDSPVIETCLSVQRLKRAQEKDVQERARAEARTKAQERKVSGEGSVIDEFNKVHSIEEMLLAHGYDRGPCDSWRSTYQSSKTFATLNSGDHWVSFSQSDASAGLGARFESGCFGDAFDLFCHFEHGGNVGKAVGAAARLLGLDKPTSKSSHLSIIDLVAAQRAQEARSGAGQGVSEGSLAKDVKADQGYLHTDSSNLASFHILQMPNGMTATEFVVDGFLPNGVTVIAGEPGVGKTTNLVPIAASVAHLTPTVWGFHPKRSRVVVWLSEHPEQVFDTIEALLGLDGSASREGFSSRFKVVSTRRSNPEELATLIDEVNRRFSYANERGVVVHPLIVWDTAAATIDVENENDNSTISKAIALAKQSLRGAALWVITHTPKVNKGATDVSRMSARGGSAYEGDANCTAYLFNGGDGRRVLALGKIRFQPEFTEIHFDTHTLHESVVDDFDGEEVEKTVVSGLPLKGSKESRTQKKMDLIRQAQRDKVLSAAVACANEGRVCTRNNILERALPIKRPVGLGVINSLLDAVVLVEVEIPKDIHKKLGLSNSQRVVVLHRNMDCNSYFEGLLSHRDKVKTSGASYVKSEGRYDQSL